MGRHLHGGVRQEHRRHEEAPVRENEQAVVVAGQQVRAEVVDSIGVVGDATSAPQRVQLARVAHHVDGREYGHRPQGRRARCGGRDRPLRAGAKRMQGARERRVAQRHERHEVVTSQARAEGERAAEEREFQSQQDPQNRRRAPLRLKCQPQDERRAHQQLEFPPDTPCRFGVAEDQHVVPCVAHDHLPDCREVLDACRKRYRCTGDAQPGLDRDDVAPRARDAAGVVREQCVTECVAGAARRDACTEHGQLPDARASRLASRTGDPRRDHEHRDEEGVDEVPPCREPTQAAARQPPAIACSTLADARLLDAHDGKQQQRHRRHGDVARRPKGVDE